MKKLGLLVVLVLSLIASGASGTTADQNQSQDQNQGQGQGQSQIMAPDISTGVTSSTNTSITQTSEAITTRIPHPAQLFQPGMPQIFGSQSLPGNANNSFLRMMQIFPIIVEGDTEKIVKEDGDSGETDITFYYYPGYKGKGKDFNATKIETKTLLKGKYAPLGFLSITAQKGKLEFPFLLDDALKFLHNAFKIKGVPVIIAYIDPFGVSVNLGNEGKSYGLSILGGGATLHKNGDMSIGGGIGFGGGRIFPSAVVGLKIWVLIKDPNGTEIEVSAIMQPPKIGVAEMEISTPAKAKGAGE